MDDVVKGVLWVLGWIARAIAFALLEWVGRSVFWLLGFGNMLIGILFFLHVTATLFAAAILAADREPSGAAVVIPYAFWFAAFLVGRLTVLPGHGYGDVFRECLDKALPRTRPAVLTLVGIVIFTSGLQLVLFLTGFPSKA